MDNQEHFKSITEEIFSLRNRIRNFCEHCPTDGEWKESVLRTILRRHLPASIGVGKGFIVGETETSTQIDILFYDKTKPVLYQEGELFILTPGAALGAIEVKTNVSNIEDDLEKLSRIVRVLKKPSRFYGYFCYEGNPQSEAVLSKLKEATNRAGGIINALSIGKSFLIRYWRFHPPSTGGQPYNRWHAYRLENMAPAYFIFNVVEHLCPNSIPGFDKLWFPVEGKEVHKIGEIGVE